MKLQDGLGANIGVDPDGFIAFQQKYCSCDRCKSVVKDCVPMQFIQECSECNMRYAFLLKTTSTVYPQLCQGCYIKVVGMEKAMEIKDIYVWMHPSEHELWGITADDIGILVEDTKTGHKLFIPMPEANKELIEKYNFVFRGGGRDRLAQAKILCDSRMIPNSNCMENNIDWEGDNALVSNSDGSIHDATTIKEHGNRKARRAAAAQWKEHLAKCPECAEAEKANKPSLKERLFGKKKKEGCGAGLSANAADDGCFDENSLHRGQYKQILPSALTEGASEGIIDSERIATRLGSSVEDAEEILQQMKKNGSVEWTDEGWRLTAEARDKIEDERRHNGDRHHAY